MYSWGKKTDIAIVHLAFPTYVLRLRFTELLPLLSNIEAIITASWSWKILAYILNIFFSEDGVLGDFSSRLVIACFICNSYR